MLLRLMSPAGSGGGKGGCCWHRLSPSLMSCYSMGGRYECGGVVEGIREAAGQPDLSLGLYTTETLALG